MFLKRRPQQQQEEPSMKAFGAQHSNKDYDCMNQANFVALAMERKRRRHTEEILHTAASKLTDILFHHYPSPTTTLSRTSKTTLGTVMDIMESRQQHQYFDDTSSVTSGSTTSEFSQYQQQQEQRHTSEIDVQNCNHCIETRRSFQDFQDFSDVLKSEAMLRQHKHYLQQRR
jgi:hypothetical protein